MDAEPVPGAVWIEHLPIEECWRLLASYPAGRLGVLVDSAPEIYPVNHVVDRGTILFRTGAGTKRRGYDRSPSVCFEVDQIDDRDATGWSVLVKGRAVELTDPEDIRLAGLQGLHLWAFEAGTRFVRIVPAEVTGRRIGRDGPPPGATGAPS
jgi:nitroimidazol reductase NimA-like FMN-containing flavoprotein (pyridoxamine 5'-phosphate oxidase superfamily)